MQNPVDHPRTRAVEALVASRKKSKRPLEELDVLGSVEVRQTGVHAGELLEPVVALRHNSFHTNLKTSKKVNKTATSQLRPRSHLIQRGRRLHALAFELLPLQLAEIPRIRLHTRNLICFSLFK